MSAPRFFLFSAKTCLTVEPITEPKVQGYLSAVGLLAGSHGTQPRPITIVNADTMRVVMTVTPKRLGQTPSARIRQEIAQADRTAAKAARAQAPLTGGRTFRGQAIACVTCGKGSFVHHTECTSCRRGVKVPVAQVPTGKAKGNTNGNCDVPSCGKFLSNLGLCKVHG